MRAKVYSLESGKVIDSSSVELDERVFCVPYDARFVSMYYARMKSAWYVPTNKTRNISEVSGSTKKPYRQKHTGNARHGSTRSAQMRGGGIAFGPRGVSRCVKIPKSEAMLAKLMLLSKAVSDDSLFVIQNAQFGSLKTSNAKGVLSNFSDGNITIVNSGDVDVSSLLAVRNLRGVKFVSMHMLTVKDLMYAKAILMDVSSVNELVNVFSANSCEG